MLQENKDSIFRKKGISDDVFNTNTFFWVAIVLGAAFVWAHTNFKTQAATPLLWALACLASGAAVGFLFGIPKILQGDGAGEATAKDKISYRQQVNTNLEQISDWLTKIIVGLGLVQLKNIPGYLNQNATTLAISMGKPEDNLAFALALIVYFSLVGFLFGYLATRLFLAGAFARADQASTENVVENFKMLARHIEPRLLQQVILKGTTDSIIRGEENSPASERESGKTESPEEIDKALALVKGEVK